MKYWLILALALALGACGGGSADDDDDTGADPCGNGRLEVGEQCDDANDNDDDECTNACQFPCGDGILRADELCDKGIPAGMPGACPTDAAADCDDGDACTRPSITGSECAAQCAQESIESFIDNDGCCPDVADATMYTDFDCASACGNGLVELDETCDTAIEAGMPGACPTAGDCGDGIACTDDIYVTTGNPCQVRCEYLPRTALLDGDGCCPAFATGDTDSDCPTVANCGNGIVNGGFGLETCDTAIAPGQPGACPTECVSDDVCLPQLLLSEGTCRAACHQVAITYPINDDMCCPTLYGANFRNDTDCETSCGTPAAECELGAPLCDDNCRWERTAYRMVTIAVRDPHIFWDLENGNCADLTSTVNNTVIPDALRNDENGDGSADIVILNVFKPIDRAAATNTFDVTFGSCLPTEDPAATMCTADPLTKRVSTVATNTATGVCLDVLPDTTTASYMPIPNAPTDNCFTTDAFDEPTFSLGSLTVPLSDARIAAVYDADPADNLITGLLRGFVSQADADATIIPESVVLLGGKPLSAALAGGIDPACTANGTPIGDDRDVGPDGVTMGWYFYVDFTAARVPFDDRPTAEQ